MKMINKSIDGDGINTNKLSPTFNKSMDEIIENKNSSSPTLNFNKS